MGNSDAPTKVGYSAKIPAVLEFKIATYWRTTAVK
jgi:hypothetical protein